MNVPTWTGRHGQGGLSRRFGNVANPGLRSVGNGSLAPSSFSRASAGVASGVAPRSADLLAHLRQRQQQAAAAGSDRASHGSTPEVRRRAFACHLHIFHSNFISNSKKRIY